MIASVGPWLPKLSAAIGPLRSRASRSPTGEPNGFDGITRRGTYDRLLLTEWALAEEIPEEFIRRAAMREHLFLQPAQIEPSGSLRTVALFDAGPDQLGPLRLVHLAILMVLKRRAAQVSGLLQWGHLQHKILHTDLDRSVGPLLFSARTAQTPTIEAIQRWQEALTETKTEDDLWIIGGQDAQMPGAHRVEILDPYDPDRAEALLLLHHYRGQPPLELTLPLPSDSISSQLIRAPFAPHYIASTRQTYSPGSVQGSVRFNSTGGAIITHSGASIRSWGTPRSGWSRPREHRGYNLVEEHPVAVGWYRKRLFCAVAKGGTLQHRLLYHQHWRKALKEIPLHPEFILPDSTRPIKDAYVLPLGQRGDPNNPHHEKERTSILLEDAHGALWVACFATGTMTMLLSKTAKVIRCDMAYLAMIPSHELRTLVVINELQSTGNIQAPGMHGWSIEHRKFKYPGSVDWVRGFNWGKNPVVIFPNDDNWTAAKIRRHSWLPEFSNPISVPYDEEVFACEYDKRDVAIYTISADRMAVQLHRTRHDPYVIFDAPAPILSAHVSYSRKLIGYWMENGELGFYNPDSKEHYLKISVDMP